MGVVSSRVTGLCAERGIVGVTKCVGRRVQSAKWRCKVKINRLLHAAVFTPTSKGWGLPVLFEGEPGVGKSAVIEDFATDCGLACEVLSAAERGEGAFGVVPVPSGGLLTYPAPDWVSRMSNGGIVFCDEITSSPPALQAPQMGLVHAKRIGSFTLGPRVRVIGACNPPDVAANGYDLAPPLANRFGWVRWPAPTVEEHAEYMLGSLGTTKTPIDAFAEEARVMSLWPEAMAKAVGLEVAFLGAHQDWKNKFPKSADASASRAWPSDRSWENAVRALASASVHSLTQEETDTFVSGFIGRPAYEAFSVFIENTDMPNVVEVLDGKAPFTHKASRLDQSAALMNSAIALLTPTTCPNREARAEILWDILSQVGANAKDLVVPIARHLVGLQLRGKSYVKVLSSIRDVSRHGAP